MPVFQPTYKHPKTGKQTKAATWWYDFTFAGRRIREPAKTKLKTLARMAEQKRRRELEEGFNGLADKRATGKQVGKAYTPEEKERLLAEAKAARSPVIYPALMLALNAGIRDAELRTMQWERLDLAKAYLTVGDSKTDAGEGRTIPLN